MIKNVFFDLDGTIIDSKECIFTIYKQLFAELNLILPSDDDMEWFIGPPISLVLKRYLPEERVNIACDRFRELYKSIDLLVTNKPYAGIAEALEKLCNETRLFLTTSKNEYFAKKIMHGFTLDKYFIDIYGSIGETHGRSSKSDVLRAVMCDYNITKEECLLVGDTVFDVEGAEQANIPVAIVKYGFGRDDDFNGKNIEFFADTPIELVKKLESYK